LGQNHPLLAQTLESLAVLERDQGKLPEAEKLFQRTLAIREKLLGPDHPATAYTLEHYADVLRRMNRRPEAEKLEGRAKTIREQHAKDNSPK
ncbi:MAG TPA: tetratricopeptide repeat protein, partial [Isosphaeraceae bacterium]|nr:tetratricopeptide repeat protein [Isosphaeraceae bacterium]